MPCIYGHNVFLRRQTSMKNFLKAFIITVAVLATVIGIKTAADYICRKYRKKYISI
jgi:hypothetical protein